MTDSADPQPFAFPPYERTRPQPGERAEFRKTMTVAEQAMFTGISGNMHPLYVNEVHASSTSAQSRLAFELAVASLATTALAELSGAFFRLGGIELSFPGMARIGDTVAAVAEVESTDGGRVRCRITCTADDGPVVADGHADLVEVG